MTSAPGGVASIVEMLYTRFPGEAGVSFLDAPKLSSGWRRVVRGLGFLPTLALGCWRLRGGKAVFFSSAFNSFWEKCGWVLLARACGARPIMVMVAGNFPQYFAALSARKQALARRLVRFVDTLGVQSPAWSQYYRSIFPGITAILIRGGIDADLFSPAADRGAGESRVRILYVGWMIEAKGINDLLDAAVVLKRDGQLFSMNLIGPAFGKDDELRARIRSLELEGSVEYGGVAPSKEALRDEYRAADIFAFPSHYEGFPVALLEALACGLACVATDVGGCPDILGGGRVGLLVEPRAPEKLASALRRLITDRTLREQLAHIARQRALDEYTVARSIESYCEMIGVYVPCKGSETRARAEAR
jgi:glycosyltransferase involved in cell wall biosynthesis